MKIVLAAVNAKYIHSNLAVYDLKAYAQRFTDEEITLREYTINQSADHILQDLFQLRPDAVFLSCYIWNISLIKNLTADLKKVLPGTAFFAGGPEVSYDAENFLTDNPAFTGVLRGEGEACFAVLAGRLQKDGMQAEMQGIPGLTYRDEGGIHDQGFGRPVPVFFQKTPEVL